MEAVLNFCELEGHIALPTDNGTVLAYICYLFEQGRVHAAFLDHYISTIRTRHAREGFRDPCTGTRHTYLVRAFKRQDDELDGFGDVKAALPASVVRLIHDFGLRQVPVSESERDATLLELQILMTWREATARSVEVQDIIAHHKQCNGDTYIELSARPRYLKGCPTRDVRTHFGANPIMGPMHGFTV